MEIFIFSYLIIFRVEQMDNNKKIVIYPLMEHNYELLKTRINPVYIKFIAREPKKKSIKPQNIDCIYFYLSRHDKSIIGFSSIKTIKYIKPCDIENALLSRIQMTNDEFNKYCKDRENKSLVTLELEKIIDLNPPLKLKSALTMNGLLLKSSELTKYII